MRGSMVAKGTAWALWTLRTNRARKEVFCWPTQMSWGVFTHLLGNCVWLTKHGQGNDLNACFGIPAMPVVSPLSSEQLQPFSLKHRIYSVNTFPRTHEHVGSSPEPLFVVLSVCSSDFTWKPPSSRVSSYSITQGLEKQLSLSSGAGTQVNSPRILTAIEASPLRKSLYVQGHPQKHLSGKTKYDSHPLPSEKCNMNWEFWCPKWCFIWPASKQEFIHLNIVLW